MDPQLSELRDYVVDLRLRVGEHLSGVHARTLRQVDEKLEEILGLLQIADQPEIASAEEFADNREPPTVQDDLTRIQGITDQLEKSLHSMNVRKFQTIADWKRDDVRQVGSSLAIGFLIQKQNWIEQAKILASGGETSYSRKTKKGYKLVAKPPVETKPPRDENSTARPVELHADPIAHDGNLHSETLHQPQFSQDLEGSRADQDGSSEKSRGRVQNFFRRSKPQTESVQNSEKNEKTTVPSDEKEKEAVVIEAPQNSSGEIQADTDFSPITKNEFSSESDEPIPQKISSTQASQISPKRRRTTFPDFRWFTDTSFPEHSEKGEIDSNTPEPNQSALTNDDRGVMRRFFRAITKSNKS